MKYQNLFSEEMRENISICLLKNLPRVLNVKSKYSLLCGNVIHTLFLKKLWVPDIEQVTK